MCVGSFDLLQMCDPLSAAFKAVVAVCSGDAHKAWMLSGSGGDSPIH